MALGQGRTAPLSIEGFRLGRGVVVDRASLDVECLGPVWRLNDPGNSRRVIDWRRFAEVRDDVAGATADYIESLIRTHSPSHASTAYKTLVRALTIPSFRAAVTTPGATIGFQPFEEMRSNLRWTTTYQHHYRKWYLWCAKRERPGFDPEVADLLREVTVGNEPKGRAVLSLDPEEGPLTDLEVASLAGMLRAADELGTLTADESLALWLSLALGTNPLNMVLLREEDYLQVVDDRTGGIAHSLRVPRIKKRHAKWRTEFKTRKLNPEIGARLASLIARNRERWREAGWPNADFAKPIFQRENPNRGVANSGLREYAMHLESSEIRALVAGAVEKLAVISPRTGAPLQVSPRRLRYTFITRFIGEGGSLIAAAEAADHTDTQTVLTYTNLRGDMVKRLDEAIALEMAPRAMAFLGMVVRTEGEAVRGEAEAASRVYHHARDRGAIEPVGTCGSFAFCGLTAPTACYECVRFQPWLDGPHEEVLRSYVQRRADMQERGVDEGQVRTLDRTILAVAAVVLKVGEIRRGDAT
ncbi:hypothetical protein ABE438_00765 [Bosea sp. TWI1241]|uniref:hypothetical protein n=1 Tax=Bosea sp. TWI1241 TaxID=3148904 RepID=UPI003208E041